MFKRTNLVVFLLMFSFSVTGLSQDAGKSLLKWFPRGYYELMAGQDLQAIKKSQLYSLSGKAIGSLMRDSPTMEIPGLRGKFRTAVVALIKRGYEEEVKKKKKKDELNFDILGGELLYAYQFDGLGSLLEKTMKNGRLRKVKGLVNKRPIYGYSEKGDPQLYLYATASDELLASTKKAALLKMIEAGNGTGQSMLDDPLYMELEREIPESQYWVVSLPREPLRSKLEALEDQSSEDAKELKAKIEQLQKRMIAGVEISDKLIYRENMYFEDAAAAAGFYRSNKENIFEWGGVALPGKAASSRNAELDEDLVMIRIDYSIKKIAEYYEGKEKSKKEKRRRVKKKAR